jgi:hypothetical protein
LSPHSSCTNGGFFFSASAMVTTGGSGSNSTSTRAARSSASPALAASAIATGSPTWRTLPAARIGQSEGLKPGSFAVERMRPTPERSLA